jgi:hypothetical protein
VGLKFVKRVGRRWFVRDSKFQLNIRANKKMQNLPREWLIDLLCFLQRDGRISDRRLSDRRRCDANAGDAITGDAIAGGVIGGSERGNHQQEDERWRTALPRESHPGKHRRRPR